MLKKRFQKMSWMMSPPQLPGRYFFYLFGRCFSLKPGLLQPLLALWGGKWLAGKSTKVRFSNEISMEDSPISSHIFPYVTWDFHIFPCFSPIFHMGFPRPHLMTPEWAGTCSITTTDAHHRSPCTTAQGIDLWHGDATKQKRPKHIKLGFNQQK